MTRPKSRTASRPAASSAVRRYRLSGVTRRSVSDQKKRASATIDLADVAAPMPQLYRGIEA